MKYYVRKNQKSISKEEIEWFTRFSYSFLYALQNTSMPHSEKVVFCQDCLNSIKDEKK